MTAIPDAQYSIANLVDAFHESKTEQPRPHMGCSLLGHPCDRYLWLNFRWAAQEKFPGRMLRLFRRGHMEEATVVKDLKSIGCVVTDYGDEQSRVDFGAHVSGSLDGIIQSGLPMSKKPHLLEIKTHNQKSFDALKKDGVAKTKPMHFVQMHIYMYGKGLERAIYYAVNKNTDEIYTERVRLDKAIAVQYIERGKRIALSDRMPEPLPGGSPTWFQCKFCPAYSMCWQKKPTQNVNCRTCAHSTAKPDSTWTCEKWQSIIPVEAQRQGCDRHTLHPDMVPWDLIEAESTEDAAAYLIDGCVVLNGFGGVGSKALVNEKSKGD